MATIKSSALVADIRGAVGGNVFTRNRGGLSVRTRIKPINPRSVIQQLRRAYASAAAAGWAAITAQQRADWQAYAVNTSWTNRLGDSINIGGEAAFVRLAALQLLAGLALPTAAPTSYGHASPATSPSISCWAPNSEITIVEPTGWDKDIQNDLLLIFVGQQQSASRADKPKKMNFLKKILGKSAGPEPMPIIVDYRTETLIVGKRIFIELVHVDTSNRVSVRSTHSCIITGP